MNELSAGEQKIVRYLSVAHTNERRLESTLAEHAEAAVRAPYRKRLERHRRETREHATAIERRVKELGGSVESVGDRAPEAVTGAAQTAQSVAKRAAALAHEGVRAIRGTGDSESQVENAKGEFAEEAREIATYHAIEALAEALGDRETATLARRIRREEERMAAYLEKLIPELVRSAVREEIAPPRPVSAPAPRRAGAGRKGAAIRKGQSKRAASARKSTSAGKASRGAGGARTRAARKRG